MILKDKCKGPILEVEQRERRFITKAFYFRTKHGSKRVEDQDSGKAVRGHVREQALYVLALWTSLFSCSNFPNTFYIFIKYPQGQLS